MTGKLWPLLSGFGIWALGFVALYAMQALGCVWAWPEGSHRLVLMAIWLVTLALLTGLLLVQRRGGAGDDPALRKSAMLASLAAMAATILTFFPAGFASLCI